MNTQKEVPTGIKSHLMDNIERGGKLHHLISEVEGCLQEAGVLLMDPPESKGPSPIAAASGIPGQLQSQSDQLNAACIRLEKILKAVAVLNQ